MGYLTVDMDYLAVDSGTTHSRVWLVRDLKVLNKRQVAVGVRNTAIDGNTRALTAGIHQAISELRDSAGSRAAPQLVIAAGMITSNLGIHEVKHVEAPVGIDDLAAKIEERVFPEITDLPFYFVPGVRSGPVEATLNNLNSIDIVRGEETEVMGALLQLQMAGPLLYIHLGSHTKLIKVDGLNRIAGGRSTLAGELLQTVRTHTILKDSLPNYFADVPNMECLNQGWDHAKKYGFFRALYLVRVLQLNSRRSKGCILSFFLGAMLSEEFRCLDSLLKESTPAKFILSGLPYLQRAWKHFLARQKRAVYALSADQTEAFFLAGLYEILKRRGLLS
jgi:2-dehydro-3-deoxygalactonokinase